MPLYRSKLDCQVALDILHMFRLKKIGVLADIKQAFLNIGVSGQINFLRLFRNYQRVHERNYLTYLSDLRQKGNLKFHNICANVITFKSLAYMMLTCM